MTALLKLAGVLCALALAPLIVCAMLVILVFSAGVLVLAGGVIGAVVLSIPLLPLTWAAWATKRVEALSDRMEAGNAKRSKAKSTVGA